MFYLLACGTACALLKYGDVYEAPKPGGDQHDIDFYIKKEDYKNIRPKIDPYFQDSLNYKIVKNAEFKIQMQKQITNGEILIEFYIIEILKKEDDKYHIKYSTNGNHTEFKKVSFDNRIKLNGKLINIIDKNYCNEEPYTNI